MWFRYFFGTPQRFATTFVLAGLVVVMVSPGLLEMAVSRFVRELNPLIGPAIQIGVLVLVFRIILSGFTGKK